jgi:hypothetical protein
MQGKTHSLTKDYWEWAQIRQSLKLECVRVKGHTCYPGSDRLCQECFNEVKMKEGKNDT